MDVLKYNSENHTLEINGEVIQLDTDITIEQLKQIPLFYLPCIVANKANSKIINSYLLESVKNSVGYIATDDKMTTLAHELGHIQDDLFGIISADQNLIDIYNQEISEFNLRYTNVSGKEYIDYFSMDGGSASTGLSELVAETNMLLTTCGNSKDDLVDRTQFLAQNFPKTISYIASKFGLNAVE